MTSLRRLFAPLIALLLLASLANSQESLGRLIVPFDFAPIISVFFSRLEQPIQTRTIFLYNAAWYNALVVHSEDGRFVNGSEPLFRRPDLPDNSLGNAATAIIVSMSLHIFGEAEGRMITERAAELSLDVPLRAEDVADDNPAREDLLLGFQIAAEIQESVDDDGFNENGTDDGSTFNLLPYEDVTSYAPINTPDEIRDLRRWTPLVQDITPLSIGRYDVQRVVAPQAAFTETPLLTSSFANRQRVRPPYTFPIRADATCAAEMRDEQTRQTRRICEETDEVLEGMASLTAEDKAVAEYFDDTMLSLTLNVVPLSQQFNVSFREGFLFVLLVNGGMYETTLLTWREKRRHDAVRPTTLIQQLYKDVPIASDRDSHEVLGQDFASFIPVRPRQEYPSLHASQCQYFASLNELLFGNEVTIDVEIEQGSSTVQPNVLPEEDMTIRIRNFQTDIAEACAESRIKTGTNLRSAVTAGRKLGRNIAPEYLNRLACIAPTNKLLPPCQM